MIYIVNNFDSTLFLRFFLFHVLCGGNFLPYAKIPVDCINSTSIMTGAT